MTARNIFEVLKEHENDVKLKKKMTRALFRLYADNKFKSFDSAVTRLFPV